MKRLLPAAIIVAMFISCNSGSEKGKFTVSGEIKNAPDKKVYLEELFFSQKPPEVLDTGILEKGKFNVSAIAKEEGLYRIRTESEKDAFLFINDAGSIKFTADAATSGVAYQSFGSAANLSLKKVMLYADSMAALMAAKNNILMQLKKAGTAENDSTYMVLNNEFKSLNDNMIKHLFAVADTSKSPILGLFAATMAPVPMTQIEAPMAALAKRFPDHKGIAGAVSYIKEQIALQTQVQPQSTPGSVPTIGNVAPEITMNDVNDKPFSLSQLKGKYVLVDFWASWCGPCREENPNLVAAYERFKTKNFTVLGVSLDDNKNAWLAAIAADKLAWQQISDLKKWKSAAVGLYGLDGIPYNVLVDPQGKIIATGLRGSDLHNKLAELLK